MERNKVNPKLKWALMILLTLWVVITGLLYSTIGHATLPTEEERTVLAAQNAIISTVKLAPGLDTGSGFFVDKNTILTNWHVVKKTDRITFQHNGRTCDAKVGYRDEGWDLALLQTECEGVPLTMAPKTPRVGTTVLAVGNPSPFESFVSKGIVSGTWNKFLMADIYAKSGSSGGPLVNLSGEVVGVVTGISKEHQGITAAVAVEDVRRFLEAAQ